MTLYFIEKETPEGWLVVARSEIIEALTYPVMDLLLKGATIRMEREE